MNRPALASALVLLASLSLVGVAGYMLISGMGFVDALYMTVITLSTVGFGETLPLDASGRVFTISLIVCGLGVVAYAASQVVRELVEGEIRHALGRRKVQKQIAHMKGHIIVCGFGRMGAIVCKELAAKPALFVVVENDHETVLHIEETGYLCVEGDATEDAILVEAGIERAAGLVTALSKDAENLYVVLTARELNAKLVIVARAEDGGSERKLMRAGATRVVSPYVIGGYRMAHALLRPAVLDVIDLATHDSDIELQIEEVTVVSGGFGEGETLQESGIRDRFGIIVIAIKKASGEMIFNPDAKTRIEAGDKLVVMGENPNLLGLERKVQTGT